MPMTISIAISGQLRPIRTDIETNQQTTGNQITGIAHQTVRVKNCYMYWQIKSTNVIITCIINN